MIKVSISLDVYNIKSINQAKLAFSDFIHVKVKREKNVANLEFECSSKDKEVIVKSFLNYCLNASADSLLEA